MFKYCLLIWMPGFLLAQGTTFKVFYLGGQSNMDGYGKVSELPDSLNRVFEGVYIFHGNSAADGAGDGGLGIWEELQPGHGGGFVSDGKANYLSQHFGLELSFVAQWQGLFPNDRIALIKYARGGSSLDSLARGEYGCWEPDFWGTNGVNQYDHFLQTLQYAFQTTDIDGDGQADELIPAGILWMQGESDAGYTQAVAERYPVHLKRLMDLIRAALHQDDIPVVIGKISDVGERTGERVYSFGELVRFGQEQYVQQDRQAGIVRETITYGYSDNWHYDTEGYIKMGAAFARILAGLQKR